MLNPIIIIISCFHFFLNKINNKLKLISVWCINEWRKLGSPSPFQLVELGPGRGTLMTDILKVLSHFKLNKNMSIHFVEISPHLSKLQAQRLCYKHNDVEDQVYYRHGETISGTKVFWYKRIEDVPEEFSIVLAHEFFDALPVHKLQKDEDGVWKEILVDIDPDSQSEKLRYVMSKSQTPISKIFKPSDDDSRVCLELNLETEKIVRHLASRFERDGGFGLFMDYGHFGDKSDTFRAFKKHKLHDPLVEPGTADLTADVDFKHIQRVAEEDGKLITFGPVEQGTFLDRMEGPTRLQILLDHSSPDDRANIESGYKMLTEPSQMGARFKFFSLFPSILKTHLEKFPVSGFSK